MVFIQVVRGHPGGRLQLSGGDSKWLGCRLHSHPFSQDVQRKKDNETWQWMRVVDDWSYDECQHFWQTRDNKCHWSIESIHCHDLTKRAQFTTVKELIHCSRRWTSKRSCCLTTAHWRRPQATDGRRPQATDGLLQGQMFLCQHTQTFLQYPRLFHLLLELHSTNLHTTTDHSRDLLFTQQKISEDTKTFVCLEKNNDQN